ncbi:hypothetical protein MHB64_31920 [Paenibacillus sp. FSL K6-2859]|uniref:glutamate ligase domain-containing protein n=1 Tax=Paenibacillus sp. FSL K6-2859 TaxID=2921482 RepID=UPI0030FB2FB6
MLDISKGVSDLIILTRDDLKGADQTQITEELRKMAELHANHIVFMEDRTKAIEYAWNQIQSGDAITITGKGNETYEIPFELPCPSDRATLEYLLKIYN